MANGERTSLVRVESLKFRRSEFSEPIKVYKRRWYCLFLYALLCFTYGFTSSAFGAVSHAFILAFNWTKAFIAVQGITLNVMFFLTFWFTSWLLDTKGLRVSFLLASGFLVAGAALPCITSTPKYTIWTFTISSVLSGVANPVVNGGEGCFSVTWFPPNQRNIATACAIIGIFLGISIGSICGSEFVPIRHPSIHNASTANFTSNITNITTSGVPQYILQMREDIMFYARLQFGLTLLVFLAFLVYFPSKPPTKPSLSADSGRMDYKTGVKSMLEKPMFWIIMALYSLTSGVNGGTAAFLDLILLKAGIPNDEVLSGFMLLGSTLGGIVFAFILASLADRFGRLKKHFLTVVLTIGFGLTLWFALLVQHVFVPTKVNLYVTFIIGQTMLLSVIPILYELGCDVTHPVGEGLTGGAISLASNITTFIFVVIQAFPLTSALWMAWISTGALGLCIPLILIFKPAEQRM